MQISSILLIAVLLCPVLAFAQAKAGQPAASAAQAEVASGTAASAAPEAGSSARRLKFKGRGRSCHCADPLGEEEIEAAARALAESDRRTPPKRSP